VFEEHPMIRQAFSWRGLGLVLLGKTLIFFGKGARILGAVAIGAGLLLFFGSYFLQKNAEKNYTQADALIPNLQAVTHNQSK